MEQLYPFPEQEVNRIMQVYAPCREIMWVQEEPKNMGAWSYIQAQFQERNKLRQELKSPLHYVGREAMASPAVGSYALHKKQYEAFMEQVFLG
jgi:2-oxoglutarate dehydrogenase E1 component